MLKFLNAQSIAPIEIRGQLCQVYGPNIRAVSKQMVRRWCKQFKAGRQHVHDEERTVMSSTIVELVREHIMENRHLVSNDINMEIWGSNPSLDTNFLSIVIISASIVL